MKKFILLFVCLISTAYCWDEGLPTNKMDLKRWYDQGIELRATHLIIVCDQFSYEEYPEYVYFGSHPLDKVKEINSRPMYGVMEVYAMHLDFEPQYQEKRSWHVEFNE